MSLRGPLAVVVLCLTGVSACAANRAAEQLAEKTAANAGVIGAHLRMLAQDSADLADLRAANVASLHAANARRRASYNYDIALTKRSGGADNLELIGSLEAWGKEIDAIFKAAENAEKERKAAVLATQTSLDTKSESLAQIAEALAALAKEDSNADRARFLAGYVIQLGKETDAQLDQSNKSAVAAKGLLSDVKGRLTGAKD
jgi:hypothetical protein